MSVPHLRLPLIPRWLRVAATLTVALVIFTYSILDPPGSSSIRMGPFGLIPYATWLHVLAYGGLAGAAAYALHDTPRPAYQLVFGAFCLVAAYGLGIELFQSTLADRHADLVDVGVNALGAGLAAIGWLSLTRYARFYRAHRPTDLEFPIE